MRGRPDEQQSIGRQGALRSAELLAVGSELTMGKTRDSNGVELAASLSSTGVGVRRIIALSDDLPLVAAQFREALATVDLTVATGGLGPTPDDLTREALATAVGEEPRVDPALESWLREMFARRGIPLPEVNLKQAWRIPSATSSAGAALHKTHLALAGHSPRRHALA
jgi:nicotinamide-nucleotide amidase